MVPNHQESTTFEEEVNCLEARSWIEATSKEMQSLSVNDTQTIPFILKRCKSIASKWIYKLNEGVTNDEKPRYQARLVIEGFTHRKGIDCT